MTGHGSAAQSILDEAKKVESSGYELKFKIPTAAELQEIRHIHRERPEELEQQAKKATEGLSVFLEAFSQGVLDLRDLPPAMRTQLTESFLRQIEVDNEAVGDE